MVSPFVRPGAYSFIVSASYVDSANQVSVADGLNVTVNVQPATTPAPTPTPDPQACAYPSDPYFNSLAHSSGALRALLTMLHNKGLMPNFKAATLPRGQAAKYDPATNTVLYDEAQFQSSRQPAAEIAYHELVHDYITDGVLIPVHGPSPTMTVGSYVVTYAATAANAPVVGALGHAFVHTALVSAFGEDDTGAAYEMFGLIPDKDAKTWIAIPGVTVQQRDTAGQLKTLTDVSSVLTAVAKRTAVSVSGGSPQRNSLATDLQTRADRCLPPGVVAQVIPTNPWVYTYKLALPADFGEDYVAP